MPKIAIDISPLYNGNSIRGVGYYTKNLVESIQEEIKTNCEFKDWQIDLVTDNNDLESKKYDLIHYPFFDLFFLTLPKKKNIPVVVTVHDLIPRQFKKNFPVGLKGEIKWLLQKNSLKKVNYIITISQYSKYIIKDIVGFPEQKIFSIYEGANKNFKPLNNSKKLKEIVKKYNLPKKFVFYVGDINWNKNIPMLAKACLELNYPLVIGGTAATKKTVDHPWTKDIRFIQSIASKLILTGFIADEDLPCIYNLATLYCQPSLAEGFGLPVVEAMKCGCPVVYSNKTSLPEIMDNCGESFDPYSIKSLKKALTKIWTSDSLRKKYIRLGLKRSKFFDWKNTALQTLAVYKLALCR